MPDQKYARQHRLALLERGPRSTFQAKEGVCCALEPPKTVPNPACRTQPDRLLAVSYRGYGGSSGSPSEAALIEDARAAYTFARAKGHASKNIILFGESLGSGVAIALAVENEPGGIILEASFSSALAVASSTYWMFPQHKDSVLA